jgi:SAM-dependent methyltransferase
MAPMRFALQRPDEFDLVVSIDVLEHVRDRALVLRALVRSLKPRGVASFHLPTVRERRVALNGRLTAFQAWIDDEHIAGEQSAQAFSETAGRADEARPELALRDLATRLRGRGLSRRSSPGRPRSRRPSCCWRWGRPARRWRPGTGRCLR